MQYFDIKKSLFYETEIVQLSEKDSNKATNISNSYQVLQEHFFQLVDELILKKYDYDKELCNDKSNICKISIFVNMLNLYNIYVDLIPKKFDQELVCDSSAVNDLIKSSKAVRLFKNDKGNKEQYGTYFVLNLETFEDRVKKAFNPGDEIRKLCSQEQSFGQKVGEGMKNFSKKILSMIDKKAQEYSDTELAKKYKDYWFHKSSSTEVINWGKYKKIENWGEITKIVVNKFEYTLLTPSIFNAYVYAMRQYLQSNEYKNGYKIKNANVFSEFIKKMTDYNFETDDSSQKEKKLFLKLDFILFAVNNFSSVTIDPSCYTCPEIIENKDHNYDIRFACLVDEIKSLSKNKLGKIPASIILSHVLNSNLYEKYDLEMLKEIFQIAADDNDKMSFAKAIAENSRKELIVSKADEFMKVMDLLVDYLRCTKSKNNDKMTAIKKYQSLPREQKKLLSKILDKIDLSLIDTDNKIIEINPDNVGLSVLDFIVNTYMDFDLFVLSVFVKKFRLRKNNNNGNSNKKNSNLVSLLGGRQTDNNYIGKVQSAVKRIINVAYAYYTHIENLENKGEMELLADAVKFFYGNFLFPIVSGEYKQIYISPVDFTHLLDITNFLSEKGLLQKIIDSGDAIKQKNTLNKSDQKLSDKLNNNKSVQKLFDKTYLDKKNSRHLQKPSLEEQIKMNNEKQAVLNSEYVSSNMKYNERLLDGFPISNSDRNMMITTNDNDNNNIINEYSKISLDESDHDFKTKSQNTNKFDVHRINRDLLFSHTCTYFNENEAPGLYDLYKWYEYFIKNEISLVRNKFNWYQWFLKCQDYLILSNSYDVHPKLVVDFFVAIYHNKKISMSAIKVPTVNALKNVFARFDKYVYFCFESDNLPNFKKNMNTLIDFASAILSLYLEPQSHEFYSDGFFISKFFKKHIQCLKEQEQKVQFSKSDYIYYKYTLSKLILTIKSHFLQFKSMQKLPYLSQKQSPSFKNDEKLRIFLSDLNCLDDFLEIPIKIDGQEFVETTALKKNNNNESNAEQKKSSDEVANNKEKDEKYPSKNSINENSDIDGSVKKDNQSNVNKDQKKSIDSSDNTTSLEFDLNQYNIELQKLEQCNQIHLIELFSVTVKTSSGFFIRQYGFLKKEKEKKYAISSNIAKLFDEPYNTKRHLDIFYPWAFDLVKQFYQIFSIKYRLIVSPSEHREVVNKFAGFVFENFFFDAEQKEKLDKVKIQNVLCDYFDQLVYADDFEQELPRLLEKRKKIPNLMEDWKKEVNKKRQEFKDSKTEDDEIKCQVLITAIDNLHDEIHEKAKTNLGYSKKPDNALSDEESNAITEEFKKIEQNIKNDDSNININRKKKAILLMDDKLIDKNKTHQELLKDDINSGQWFGENGFLKKEYEEKKNAKYEDLSLDQQLKKLAHMIIWNQNDGSNNKQNYVTLANIESNLKEYTKETKEELVLNINTLSENIARGAFVGEYDAPKTLFEIIQKVYKLESKKICLDDVFGIIKIILLDKEINTELIDIFMDKNLFAEKSLSTNNLKTLAQIIEFKNKDIDVKKVKRGEDISNNGKKLVDFLDMLKPKPDTEKLDAGTFFDCVSVFYCKKINNDKSRIGNFTDYEMREIIDAFYKYCDEWSMFFDFVQCNWDGNGEVYFDPNTKIWSNPVQSSAVMNFFESLIKPAEISRNQMLNSAKNNKNEKIDKKPWLDYLINSMRSIKTNLDNALNSHVQFNLSNILSRYAGMLYDDRSTIEKVLTHKDYAEILDCYADILLYSKVGQNDEETINCYLLDYILLKAKEVKFPMYELGKLVDYISNGHSCFSPLKLLNYFLPEKNDDRKILDNELKIIKKVVVKQLDLDIYTRWNLNLKEFEDLQERLVTVNLKFNVDEFISYLNVGPYRLCKSENGENDYSLFEGSLKLLEESSKFNNKHFESIIECCFGSSGKYSCRDLIDMCIKLRSKSLTNFTIIGIKCDDQYEKDIKLRIAQSIANTDAKNLQDKFKELEDVLGQILKAKIKLKIKELEEIFNYYGFDKQKLDICQINDQNSQTNLNLFRQCVSIISREEFKREIIAEENKNEKDKTENLGPGLESKAVKFLMKHFTNTNYNFLQMDNDNIVNLIVAVLSGDEEADGNGKKTSFFNFIGGNNEAKEKQETVLNLLCLFWEPVTNQKMINDELTNKLKEQNNWINDTAFQKNMAVMYFAKHLYNLLIAVRDSDIKIETYQQIASSITKLQSQMSEYNKKSKTKITRTDISGMYNDMIIESNLPFKKIEGDLFDEIKDGILNLIVPEDDNQNKDNKNTNNKCVKYDEKKIIISFAILNKMRLYSNGNINYDYQAIFNYVTEVIKDLNGREKYPLDLETLKFVFDQMLGRGDSQGENNKLSIKFDEAGKKLFNAVLDCLDDNSVKHSEVFDFLQEYFIPTSIYVQPRSQKDPWYKRLFANLKRVFTKKKPLQKRGDHNEYLTMKNLIAQKDNKQQNNSNNPQVNQPQLQFQLNADNVFTVMKKSKNHFLFYSSKSQEDNSGNDNLDNNFTEATKNFLNPVKNDLLSSHIIDFVGKFRFQDIDSFEDFMKQYWKYDKLFSEDEITQIYTSNSFCQLCRSDDIKQCIVKLMFAKKINNYECENEKGENNHNRELLAHLVKIIKDSGMDIKQLKQYCLAFYNLNAEINEDAEKIEELYGKIDIMFGRQKRYKNWGYGLLFVSLVAVVCLIILCSCFNPYLLILFIISGIFSCFCIRELYQRKKFNDKIDAVEKIKKALALDKTKIDQFYIDKPVENVVPINSFNLDFPSQEEIQNQIRKQ